MPSPTSPEGDYAPVPRQGWWNRNWKWAVPVGCLAMLGSCFCFATLALGWGYASIKDMNAYTEAVAQAQDDAEVRKALGGSFKAGFPSSTKVKTVNGHTRAALVVPLDGPEADGTLHAVADKNGETWTFRTLYVDMEDGQRIDLLDTGEGKGSELPPEDDPFGDNTPGFVPGDESPGDDSGDDAPSPPEPDEVEPHAPKAPLPPPKKNDPDIDL
jgi:hypothetical protein